MRLVKIGPHYIDFDNGVSATDDGDSIVLWDTATSEDVMTVEVEEEGNADPDLAEFTAQDVTDLRKWLDKNSDDIHTRGGVGPVTMQDTRR